MSEVSKERERIDFLIKRDGLEKTREWVEMGLATYIDAAVRESKYWANIQEFQKFLEETKTDDHN